MNTELDIVYLHYYVWLILKILKTTGEVTPSSFAMIDHRWKAVLRRSAAISSRVDFRSLSY